MDELQRQSNSSYPVSQKQKYHAGVSKLSISSVQVAADVMMCGMFSWHILSQLIVISHGLNATACLSVVADHVHPITVTVYHFLMDIFSRIMSCVTSQTSSRAGLEA